MPAWTRIFCLIPLALTACAGPSVRSTADSLNVSANANVARNTEGTWDSSFYGVTPTNVSVDGSGASVQTGGPNTVMGLTFAAGENGETQVFISNPADTKIGRLTARMPDQTTIDLVGLESSKSIVIASRDQQVLASFQTQGFITREQADVVRQALATGATWAEAIAAIANPIGP